MKRCIINKSKRVASFKHVAYHSIPFELLLHGKLMGRVNTWEQAVKWTEEYNF